MGRRTRTPRTCRSRCAAAPLLTEGGGQSTEGQDAGTGGKGKGYSTNKRVSNATVRKKS